MKQEGSKQSVGHFKTLRTDPPKSTIVRDAMAKQVSTIPQRSPQFPNLERIRVPRFAGGMRDEGGGSQKSEVRSQRSAKADVTADL
jgi:hypothetical protein